MKIFLDCASIYNEFSRRRPSMDQNRSGLFLNRTNSPEWATLWDATGTVDGPADFDWENESFEDYHGFIIQVLPVKNVGTGNHASHGTRGSVPSAAQKTS